MHHPTDRIAHTTAFVTPVVEHWPEREIWPVLHDWRNKGRGALCYTNRGALNKCCNMSVTSCFLKICKNFDKFGGGSTYIAVSVERLV